ncbi:hypothetical protein [Paraglaciecola sp. L3A3]|uniref:hypothetical protein n=1 Tax=Paraglaciecola sp. L3A3 TaxID=2686358 RepID=UPI00131AFEA6|nr:hypothetical protein [Paraglaciecola sp. L3A3]
MNEMIRTFNMATMPNRFNTCIKTIESIYDQADIIRLYLNNFDSVPEEYIDPKIITHQGKDLKSTGKLFWATNVNEYYFCVDDDLYYPPSYADDMINKLNQYNDDIIVSLHGKNLLDGYIDSYFKGIKHNYRCLDNVSEDTFVDVIGNGVSLFNTNKIKIDWQYFKYHYMDDIMVSISALNQSKRRLVMKHSSAYLKYMKPKGPTLFHEYSKNDKTQTEMVNSVNWKK